jgi:hypothetical protein
MENKEHEMKQYIGTKIIKATPMTAEDAWGVLGRKPCTDNAELRAEFIDGNSKKYVHPGYLVEYPDGYQSWSPRKQFEEAYRPMVGMTFGQAIEALKAGQKVARESWNGKGMFVFKQVPSPIKPEIVPNMTSLPQSVKDEFIKREQGPNYQNQMAIVKPDGSVDSWVASSSDTFAEDWCIV